MKKVKVILFVYNRFFDPLVQSNFWPFITNLLNDPETNPYKFCVVTYENKKAPLTKEEAVLVRYWESKGLEWLPLTWHPGVSMVSKAKDIINGLAKVILLRLKGYKYIVALGSIAGTFAYLYSLVLRTKLFLYSYEPHSEYAYDNKMWPAESKQYKITNYLEKKSAYYATVISSGTRFMEERLKQEWKVAASFVKIPSMANQDKFVFSDKDRVDVRRTLKISEDKWVLFYPGKFGDLYYKEETAMMFKWLSELEPRLHFLIVTPQPVDEVRKLFTDAKVEPSSITITTSSYETIHPYFSAADFAIIAVPYGPSKKFVSNIKVGEYLCAGLPFLITKGVSEDYWYAENKGVGVVVNDFTESDIKNAWPEIKSFLESDAVERRAYCRMIGLEYRGFGNLRIRFKEAMNMLAR